MKILSKKLFFFVFVMVLQVITFHTHAGNNHQKCQGDSSDVLLNVVIFDEQTKLSQAIMAGMEKYWTCCKYEFIDIKEMKTRCQNVGYFLVVLGPSTDKNSLGFDGLAILNKSTMTVLNSGSLYGPVYVKTDNKTQQDVVIFEEHAVAFGIENNKVESGPEFYLALLNEMFQQKYINKIKKRCYDGSNTTKEGVFYFDGYNSDFVKGKTLLIDEQTSEKMLKIFDDEEILKTIISKTTLIPRESIFILTTEELCKSFLSGKEDLLYMFTYYNFIETHLKNNIGTLWMAPNIVDAKGKFVASLDQYRELKKLHK